MELWKLTATELLALLRSHKITAEALTRYYLARIEKYDGRKGLNSIAELDATALAQARALDRRPDRASLMLHGLPVLVKDNIDVKGLHTTAGSLALENHVAWRDAPVVTSLRRHGAILLGKTNMTEFANYTTQGMPGGYSSRGGQVINAYQPAWEVSGSSSGSAVAVSAGLCAVALGTDTSFSVVGCALASGVVGLKPPHDALPCEGVVPIAHTLDSVGTLTRSFSDALLFYNAMHGAALPPISPVEPRKIRLAVNNFNEGMVPEPQKKLREQLLFRLRETGAQIQEICQPPLPQLKTIMCAEFRPDLEAYLQAGHAPITTLREIVAHYEANPKTMLHYGDTLLRGALEFGASPCDQQAYQDALALRAQTQRELHAALREYDACLMTGPTHIMHFAGLPSLSLPLSGIGAERTSFGGLILYGVDEVRLYAAALTLERFCGPHEYPDLP